MELEVPRFTTYFGDWCFSFGHHRVIGDYDGGSEFNILESTEDRKIGILLDDAIKKKCYEEFFNDDGAVELEFFPDFMFVNNNRHVVSENSKKGIERLLGFLRENREIYMYVSSHFTYLLGARIVTFSDVKPSIIMYRPMKFPLVVKF